MSVSLWIVGALFTQVNKTLAFIKTKATLRVVHKLLSSKHYYSQIFGNWELRDGEKERVMDFHHMISSSPFDTKNCRIPILTNPSWARCHQHSIIICFNSRINYCGYTYCCSQLGRQQSHNWKSSAAKKKKFCLVKLNEENARISKKKGSIAGAVALVIGTSIGSGILALPKKTSPAGLLPSSISLTICWGFLLIEALLLVEINVRLLRKKKLKVEEDELEVISIRTMAQEALGEWGGALATVTYVFLGYTSMVAYSSKSGEILYHLINLPESVSGVLFTALFTILISVGGTRATDQVNQWLTTSMIGLLISIEVLAIVFGGWPGTETSGDWEKVPATIPVMIFSLVFHDLVPVLCAYLGGDLWRVRTSVLLGSVVPLLALLFWNAIALGLSSQANEVTDPVELLMSVRWSGLSFMVEAFSLLAVGTSLIGTFLGFSEFFKEQLNNLSLRSPSTQFLEKSNSLYYWWRRNKISLTATAMVIVPSLLVSTTVPDAFSAATDIAGGYCMTMLYGVLPPAMAFAMEKKNGQDNDETAISRARPALIGVGLFACGIVVEQILQDLSMLHS
ncbi:Tryptophan/tyrosine permease [Abeliophyllum distichum]|uniref:Tryptophan/tyrosine permease n=1 Tax=Abeliophyllum distichum TaxID=126358 RepID=A0ABD1UMY5_9LAMI